MSENNNDFAVGVEPANGAGIPLTKLNKSTGPKNPRNLHAKHPSSLARRLKAYGVDWVYYLASAMKAMANPALPHSQRNRARDDVRMWLKLLPYMVTTTNRVPVRRWKGRASKAAVIALEALEGREDA